MPSPKRLKFAFRGGLFITLFGAALLYLASIANGPDRDLVFVREVHSPLDAKTLDQSLRVIINWPKWFFSTADAQRVDLYGRAFPVSDQFIVQGCLVKLFLDPGKGTFDKFELLTRVSEYLPERRLRLQILTDSKGKLTSLFNRLEWEIELVPKPDGGTLIRGSALAHTSHWRSRLFGTLARRILMSQVLYPDLSGLAAIKQPSSAIPKSQAQQ